MAQRWNAPKQDKPKVDEGRLRVQYIQELLKKKPELHEFLKDRGELKAGGISSKDLRTVIDGGAKELLEFYQVRDVNIFRQIAGEFILAGPNRGFSRDELITLINSVQNKNQAGVLTELLFGSQRAAIDNARRTIDSAPKDVNTPNEGLFNVEAAEQRKLAGALQLQDYIEASPGPSTVYSSNVSQETLDKVEAAKKRLKERRAHPKKFLSAQDIADMKLIKTYDDKFFEQTRYVTTDDYKKFDQRIKKYQDELRHLSKRMPFSSAAERDAWVKAHSLSRGHLVPKSAQPHLHNADTNISVQGLLDNKSQWATMSLADFVNNMDQISQSGPRLQGSALKLMSDTIKQLEKAGVHSGRLKGAAGEIANSYPTYKMPINPSDPAWSVSMFDDAGNFRKYSDMLEDPSTGVKTPGDYERYRRLFITMMQGNPEWDLDGYLAARPNLPRDFIDGIEIDSKQGRLIPIHEVAGANADLASKHFGSQGKAVEFLKGKGGKAGLAMSLLAAAGYTYASDEDPNDPDTWGEKTLNGAISLLEAYDNATVGQYNKFAESVIPAPVLTAGNQAEQQVVEYLDNPDAWWNPQIGGDRGTVGLGTAAQWLGNFAADTVREPAGAIAGAISPWSENNLGTLLWNAINTKAPQQKDGVVFPEFSQISP